MSKEINPAFITIPGASNYAMSQDGTVTNMKSNTPVFPKDGKVRLYIDAKKEDRKFFDVEKLKAILFEGQKAEAKKVAPANKIEKEKTEKPKKGSMVKEIRELLDKGKTREQIEALGKYNPSTIRAQFYFKRAEDNAKK